MNTVSLTLDDPLQIDEARRACQMIAERRRAARKELQKATENLAEKERLYRKRRSVCYVENLSAPAAGMRDAIVDDEAANERYARDLAKGLVQTQEELLKEIDAERASLHQLITWSRQLDPGPGAEHASESYRAPR